MNLGKVSGHGILNNADIGRCPSCHELMALPVGMELDALFFCPLCHAQSKGFKWLADNGKESARRLRELKEKMLKEINDDDAR